MLKYNLSLSIRRIIKHPGFSGINILGLTIGIASFLVLFLYVSNEKSYDKHFSEYQNIYRVSSVPGGTGEPWARSLGIVHLAVSTIPEIEEATQFSHCAVGTISVDEEPFQQNDIMSVDMGFMNMFEVESVVGDLAEINKPNVAFVTEEFARNHFAKENPVGKSINIQALQYTRDLGEYEIRGIIKNTHPKTHFNYEILISQKGSLSDRYASQLTGKTQWLYNYVKLKNGVSPKQVAEKILAYYNASELKQLQGPKDYSFNLFPLKDIHLNSNYRFELKESSAKINIGFFIVISSIILFVSILNFVNLTIARYIKRSKELGIKKTVGANKILILLQGLIEVFILCFSSIIFSVLLIEMLSPLINNLFEIDFRIYFDEPIFYIIIIGVLFSCLGITALFIGFFLSGKSSAYRLLAEKNSFTGSYALKILLVGQLAIVIILLSATFLVNKQMNFIGKEPLGFDKENVLVLHLNDFSKDPKVFAEELRKQSQVASVGFTAQHFGYPAQSYNLQGFGLDGIAEFVFANYDYLKTMNIELIENRIDPEAEIVDGMVINEHIYKKVLEKYGSLDALQAYLDAQELEPDQVRVNIIGVTKDFNYSSMHEPIGDFTFWLGESNNRARFIHVRLNKGNLRDAVESVKQVWDNYYTGIEFNYFFMDEKIEEQYKAETILNRILTSFSILGILISIVGISALSLYIAQQRTKEIGVRKVNGAKVSEILAMLNKNFVKWIILSFMIATPIAYYAINKWLENFAYKTSLSWWIFALAGVLALAIALLTVSCQSWKAATRNPVEALRYE